MQPVLVVTIKPIEYIHGEKFLRWKKPEVRQSITQHGLQLAVLGKVLCGKPMIHELRKVIPIQYELNGPCLIELIEDNHVLIKITLMEDYVHLLFKSAFYLKAQGDM